MSASVQVRLTQADLGPSLSDLPQDPAAARAFEERRELFRLAGQAALDRSNGGKTLDPEARAWAKHYAAFKPLNRPLGTGEPTP